MGPMTADPTRSSRSRRLPAALVGVVLGAALLVAAALWLRPPGPEAPAGEIRPDALSSGAGLVSAAPSASARAPAARATEPAAPTMGGSEAAGSGGAAPEDPRCEPYRAAGNRLYRSLVARAPTCQGAVVARDDSSPAKADLPIAPAESLINECVAAEKGGAWVQWISELECQSREWPKGKWTLAYLPTPGSPLPASPASEAFDAHGWGGPMPRPLGSFDYDGDGIPEVLTVTSNEGSHKSPDDPGKLWTYRDGRTMLYPPAAAIKDISLLMQDVDGDGRPDLLSLSPYAEDAPDCRDGGHRFFEFPLAYHSLPGGAFRADDDAAIAYARQQCPSRPVELVEADAEADALSQDEQVAKRIVCARLWGTSNAEVLRSLGRRCKTFGYYDLCPSPTDTQKPRPDCDNWMPHLAGVEPPFRLDTKSSLSPAPSSSGRDE